LFRAIAPVLAIALLLPATAWARPYDELGRFEKEAVDDALAERHLTIDPAPEGKTIDKIHVVNEEVFSSRDSYLQLANIFHRTTRENVIRRETLFHPGDVYDQELIEETNRNLQDPFLSNVVVILPVQSSTPGKVDVLIVTRDVWSLRLNTDFEFQQGYLLFLTMSISENNLFGWRKKAAVVFTMDQGTMSIGPTYIDPNIAGTRLTLTSSVRALFSRADRSAEGSTSSTVLAYPLYSLASKWGGSVTVTHGQGIVRRFLGSRLRTVDFADTPEMEMVPWIYQIKRFGVTTSAVRSFGRRVIHRVSAGHDYSVVRPSFTEDFPADPALRDRFAAAIFPRSERVSDLFAGYSLFTPRYRVYRDFNAFDLREDVRLGPAADASVARAIPALGSERSFLRLGAGASWTADLLGGLQSVAVRWGGRVENDALVDQSYSASVYFASPVLARTFRLLGEASASAILDDTQNRLFTLGGDTGLRGYVVGDLIGKASSIAHVEARSMPLALASLRFGALVFYDVGDAASPSTGEGAGLWRAIRAVRRLRPHSDVGFGLRVLIPQLDAYVLRADWAFPTDSTRYTRAGWPGRFSIGFRQVF
jgi:hypothetical protein